MPVVMSLAAVGVIGLLMFVGWRRRWDRSPQEVPPITLKSARGVAEPPLPRWFWPTASAGLALAVLGPTLALVFHRRWLSMAAFGAILVIAVLRFVAAIWIHAETRFERTAELLRFGSALFGLLLWISTGSAWWLLGGAVAYLGFVVIEEVVGRRRVDDPDEDEHPPRLRGPGDTRR